MLKDVPTIGECQDDNCTPGIFFEDTHLLIKVNELSQRPHPNNKLGMGFRDSNNAVLEKSLNGCINDYV